MSKERKTIYEPHPVSPERKAELRAEGYKIIDVRFAPEGEKPPERPPEDAAKPLTVPQIKEVLAAKGIEVPEGVTRRDDLKALLDAASE